MVQLLTWNWGNPHNSLETDSQNEIMKNKISYFGILWDYSLQLQK